MGLGEKRIRRLDRPARTDPDFGTDQPGYSQPSEVDSSGYAIRDPAVEQGYVPAYDDPTVRVVPGGALGEAGACGDPPAFPRGERGDRSDYLPAGEYLGPQHALRPAPIGVEGVYVGDSALGGRETGLGRIPGAGDAVRRVWAPLEEQSSDLDRHLLSDREVYADLYGAGREFGSGDPEAVPGDPEGRRMGGRRLRMRSDDPGDG